MKKLLYTITLCMTLHSNAQGVRTLSFENASPHEAHIVFYDAQHEAVKRAAVEGSTTTPVTAPTTAVSFTLSLTATNPTRTWQSVSSHDEQRFTLDNNLETYIIPEPEACICTRDIPATCYCNPVVVTKK